jgi:single stranded DNA-binding protein
MKYSALMKRGLVDASGGPPAVRKNGSLSAIAVIATAGRPAKILEYKMDSLNRVTLVGVVVWEDAKVRQTTDGKHFAVFTLMTADSWKSKTGDQKKMEEYHRVIAWDSLVKTCAERVKKRCLVFLEGKIHYELILDEWTTEIKASNIFVLKEKT